MTFKTKLDIFGMHIDFIIYSLMLVTSCDFLLPTPKFNNNNNNEACFFLLKSALWQ